MLSCIDTHWPQNQPEIRTRSHRCDNAAAAHSRAHSIVRIWVTSSVAAAGRSARHWWRTTPQGAPKFLRQPSAHDRDNFRCVATNIKRCCGGDQSVHAGDISAAVVASLTSECGYYECNKCVRECACVCRLGDDCRKAISLVIALIYVPFGGRPRSPHNRICRIRTFVLFH